MKKIIYCLLILTLLLTLVGCERFMPEMCEVQFITNCDESISTIHVEKGSLIEEPQELTKEYYSFEGWYYNDNLWDFEKDTVNESIVLIAKWKEIKNSIIKCENELSDLEIIVGSTVELIFTKNSQIINDQLVYTVSDDTILKVDEYGVVKGLSEGFVYVTATEKNNENNYCVVEITVFKPTIEYVNISGPAAITVGDEVQYTYKMTPSDYEPKKVKWFTSDETKLYINENGIVTAKAEATAVYVYVEIDGVRGQKKIIINPNGANNSDYPDLQGYTIRIAQDKIYLSNDNPFSEGYKAADKLAKQQAWRDVEELFNCKIEVAAYPSVADWGPKRLNYILEQAALGVSDYDFLTVQDSKIPMFVEAGALISMEDFYILHGNNMMDSSYIISGSYHGKLYSFNTKKHNIQNVMYYNIGLLETLQEYNKNLKEPAQIFLDGDWTFEAFENYCQEVQDTMAQVFGAKGTAGDATQEYFAVSGWDSYWWVGLASNDGEPLADINTMTINIDTPHKVQAAEVVKNLYVNKLASSIQGVDQNVIQWNDGKALFNTGDLWFVGADNRWTSTMWGEDTRYGYVPWPRANDVDFDEIQVALSGTDTWVMPIGRDYSGYGEECTAENIYWAIAELFRRTDEYYKSSKDYDANTEIVNLAKQYAHSEASQKAFIYIQELIKSGNGYYDPLVHDNNPVGSLYTNSIGRTTIKGAVAQYCSTGTVETWEEAIAPLKPVLIEGIRKAFS